MTWPIPDAVRRGTLLVLLTVFSAWVFAQTGFYQRLRGWSEDAQHRLLGPTLDMGDVVIVDIDEETIEHLKATHGPWPYSRDLYAQLVRHLNAAGARAIVFDILFAESRPGDEDLADILTPNDVVAAAAFPRTPLRSENYLRQLAQAALGRSRSQSNAAVPLAESESPAAMEWPDITVPLESLIASGKARVGVITVRPDEDGTLRRVPLFHEAHGFLFPSLSLAAWASHEDLANMVVRSDSVRIRDRTLIVSDQGEVTLRFPKELHRLRIVPFHQALQEALRPASMLAASGTWQGKTVFIGSSSILFGDYAHTPMGRVSGLALSAIVRQSLDAGNVLRRVPALGNIALILCGALPAVFWALRKDGFFPAGFLWAVLTTVALVVPVGMMLFHFGWLSSWPLALVTGIFALAIAAGHGILRLRSERERLAYERVAAQEANLMKSEFLAHMAHELRTPLIAIMGFNKINQMNDQIGPLQRRRNSGVIAANCEHLLKLVNDNLDLAKIEAGQMALLPAPHKISDLVDEVVSTFGAIAGEKDIALAVRYEDPVPASVSIDGVRVRQVLLNVLGNAVKFTDKGRVDVLVRWRDDMLDITVSDTGPGIDPVMLERLFEPFQQGETISQRRSTGSGLGLNIARRLLQLMGGDIDVQSWLGQGSRFHFRLSAPVASEIPQPTEQVARFHGKLRGHVLLAEDDEDIRALMERELEALGLTVRTVANGLEAVHACEHERFDLILLDLDMPALSGAEAAQVLRAHGITTPIVALTAHALGAQTDAALAQGIDSVLVKPLLPDALALRLAEHLMRDADPADASGAAVARAQ